MGRDFGAARGEQHLVHEIDLQRFLETPDAHFLGIHLAAQIGHQGVIGALEFGGLAFELFGPFFRLVLVLLGLKELAGQVFQGLGHAFALVQAPGQIGGQAHRYEHQDHHQHLEHASSHRSLPRPPLPATANSAMTPADGSGRMHD